MNAKSLILAAALSLGASHALAADPAALNVRIAPGQMDEARGLGHVDITLTLSDVDAAAGEVLVSLPIVIANTETVAEHLIGLTARDDQGSLPLQVRDDPEALVYSRHWLAGRPVSGDLVVSYRAPIDNTPPRRGSGPPYQLRTEGGGFSAVGNTFILTPPDGRDYQVSIDWDLSAMGPGANATSSWGEGDAALPGVGSADRLWSGVFMAGPMKRYPAEPQNNGFSAAWLGEPPFDPAPLMAWTETLHTWMSDFFRETEAPPYRVFLRFNPINAGGGAALTNSFLTTYGQATTAESIKGTLAHEMIHTWTSLGPGQWYSEGNAVFYQAQLPWRAGLLSTEDYLQDINDTARRYYTNALNDTPNDQIAARFWEDTRVRTLPYDRGGLYFAVLNDRIRKASGGERSVDGLILAMIARRRGGLPVTEADWQDLVVAELGEAGGQITADMLAGGLMLPESDAFGPCFARITRPFRRFELGFEPTSLVGHVKTISGLIPGSEAEKAGLREGDVVTYAVAMDSVQGDPERTLTLQVTREGATFPVTYLPRGEWVDAYQWARRAGVPESTCRP
ncbi:hypothetical protein [Phenylobacterium sp.]|uniref:hypothetical protein n=1 Tax=Phenylobacterium sp. TaxID=1871053 RepID=UPI00272EF450|nr:hypothetical protein [Phenylobacterium sp.]MDP1875875.1 hypothetical protein [Phenylobacterium sp.]